MEIARSAGLRERKKEAYRTRILMAAETLFRENGFRATSMDAIASSADVSRKTLFNYMPSKQAVIIALMDKFIFDHMPEWAEPAASQFDDVRDVVAPRLAERLDTLARNRWLLELAAQHTDYFNPGRAEFVHPLLEHNFNVRTRRIQAVQQLGKIRSDIPASAISWYYEALRDITTKRWLANPSSKRADLHRAFADFIGVMLRGLAPLSDLPRPGGSSSGRRS
jgi:AcrR family transcriptional regulator